MDFQFRLPIGDWSKTGHSQCDWFWFNSNKDIMGVRSAYFAAKTKFRAHAPTMICNSSEAYVSAQKAQSLKTIGYNVRSRGWFKIEIMDKINWLPQTKHLADYALWFCMQGDSELELEIIPTPTDMLPFLGTDNQGRHIGQMGYSLFQ